jgi:hypothetical protein
MAAGFLFRPHRRPRRAMAIRLPCVNRGRHPPSAPVPGTSRRSRHLWPSPPRWPPRRVRVSRSSVVPPRRTATPSSLCPTTIWLSQEERRVTGSCFALHASPPHALHAVRCVECSVGPRAFRGSHHAGRAPAPTGGTGGAGARHPSSRPPAASAPRHRRGPCNRACPAGIACEPRRSTS